MVTTRHRVPQIQSLLPSVDARNSDESFVVDGRNFYFDSKGPKSGFSSRRLTAFPFASPGHVQGLTPAGIDRTFVFTGDAILTWRQTLPFMWEVLFPFATEIPLTQQFPWSCIYVEGEVFFAHPYRGLYSGIYDSSTHKMWIHQLTDSDIPGLPLGIKAMDVVRGRPIIVTDTQVVWGAVGDLSNLTPVLAGAGFQNLSQYISGTFLSLTNLVDGFIVRTTGGSLLVEFIDGDDVWRWTPQSSQERPIGPWASVRISTGANVFLSQHGLMIAQTNGVPEGWTPEFNEFFLEYIKQVAGDNRFWRVDYYEAKEMLFISESLDGVGFWRSFVLTPTRNKWGIFSGEQYGFLKIAPDLFGFIDAEANIHYFVDGFTRESEPAIADGIDRYYPRLEKQLAIPSSSAVSNAVTFNLEAPTDPFDPPAAAWYVPGSSMPTQGAQMGMDSWIEVGYLRPANIANSADGVLEIQEVKLGSTPGAALPAWQDTFITAHRTDLYGESEDWSSAASIVDGDEIEDLNTSTLEDTDLNSGVNAGNWDLLWLNYPTITFSDGGFEDWDSSTDEDEDWNGRYLSLTQLDYTLKLLASEDGITFDEYSPELVRFDVGARLYVTLTSGNFHRLRLEATNPLEYYHLQFLELTLNYNGEVV